jgi:Carboxypeptidase regulatory-like domain
VFRWLAIAVLLAVPSPAKPQCSAHCPEGLAPIAGHVFDSSSARPIAGATVHYRGYGNTFDDEDRTLNPTSLQGEVTTAADGSYALPTLPPGDYIVRVSAPGYYSGRQLLQPYPASHGPAQVLPLSSDNPPAQEGTFHLQRDLLHLQTMSGVALAAFALPRRGDPASRTFISGAFTPDGSRFGFLTSERIILNNGTKPTIGEPFERCAPWVYDLANGVLTHAQDSLSQAFCDNLAEASWDGGFLYLYFPKQPGAGPSADLAERIEGAEELKWSAADLPAALQPKLAQNAANAAADQSAFERYNGVTTEVTDDRRYAVLDEGCDGPCDCTTIAVTGPQSPHPKKVAEGCGGLSYLLDRRRDLLYYIESSEAENGGLRGELVEHDLVTGRRRAFDLPVNSPPELLVEQVLPDGTTRIAYSASGDCDPAASDYTQPGDNEGPLGITPNQFSLCFVSVPPQQSGSLASSRNSSPHD